MSQATLGFSRVTCAHTCQNPHPHLWVQVFMGMGSGFMKTCGYPNLCRGLPPEMMNKPHKGSASVNQHCYATLWGSESHGLTTQQGGAYPLHHIEIEIKMKQGGIHPPHCIKMGMTEWGGIPSLPSQNWNKDRAGAFLPISSFGGSSLVVLESPVS